MKLLVLFLLMLPAMSSGQMVPSIEPGVSKELAKWRATRYSDIRYKLDLTLEKMSPVLKGHMEITLNAVAGKGRSMPSESNSIDTAIVLDWRKIPGHESDSTISNTTLNGVKVVLGPILWNEAGRPQDYTEHDDHLVFYEGVKQGENVIAFDFTSPILTSGSAITRYIDKEDGSEYIYAHLTPSNASTAFPVFDQPDLKVRFTLSIDLPFYNEWKVVSNTALSSAFWPRVCIDDLPTAYRGFVSDPRPNRSESRCLFSYSFEETQPISPYVFAFAAGPKEAMEDPSGLVKKLSMCPGCAGVHQGSR